MYCTSFCSNSMALFCVCVLSREGCLVGGSLAESGPLQQVPFIPPLHPPPNSPFPPAPHFIYPSLLLSHLSVCRCLSLSNGLYCCLAPSLSEGLVPFEFIIKHCYPPNQNYIQRNMTKTLNFYSFSYLFNFIFLINVENIIFFLFLIHNQFNTSHDYILLYYYFIPHYYIILSLI